MKSLTTITLSVACATLALAAITHANPVTAAQPIESVTPALVAAEKAGDVYEAVALSMAMLKN